MKDLAASIRARLANEGKATGRPFAEVLQYYGLERFLYRLACSAHRESFVLKGALLLRVMHAPPTRPTRDIDLLGYVENKVETLEDIVRELCELPVDDDGLRFEASTVRGMRIKEDADYAGVRVTFMGLLSKARIPMQLDVGFGDTVYPPAQDRDYPTVLSSSATPRLRAYPLETVVAEKLEAMVYLGSLNSRMKDFFDLWHLAGQFDFEGPSLTRAVSETFRNRSTQAEPEPVALTSQYTASEATQKQWSAFIRRSRIPGPEELKRKGVTLQLLWQEYDQVQDHPYSYSQFCELYHRWGKKLSLSMRQVHRVGEKAFVDFASTTMTLRSREGGAREWQLVLHVPSRWPPPDSTPSSQPFSRDGLQRSSVP